jgi:hypothetical protein
MHITKNVFESLLGTLMNMPEKTKYWPKARKDLEDLNIRNGLHRKKSTEDGDGGGGKGQKSQQEGGELLPPSCFTLSAKENDQFIKCLMGIKVSSGYCGKIRKFLDTKKKRFSGMKSHD